MCVLGGIDERSLWILIFFCPNTCVHIYTANLVVFLAAIYQLYTISTQHVRFAEGGSGAVKAKLKW